MKKNKKLFILLGIGLILVIAAIIIIINVSKNSNRLNVIEKQWVNNNNKIVLNLGVKNNSNVFGKDGSGVFYDFITDFSNEYNLSINPITYNTSKSTEGIYFRVTNKINNKDLVLYKDHYVIVGKKDDTFNTTSDIQNRKLGVLNKDASLINAYLNQINNLNIVQYDAKDKLITEFDKQENINYMIVPLIDYLDIILKEGNYINAHLSDIPVYYTIYESGNDKTFKSIIKKYYSSWIETNFNNHFTNSLFDLFCNTLNISEEQIDKLRGKTYTYGFIENSPYETLSGSNYGGIVSTYLDDFKTFSKIDIKYTRYRNKNALISAINKKDIDLYFNYYNLNSDYENLNSLINVNLDILVPEDNYRVVNSLNSLKDETIYVLENSKIAEYLANNELNIKTYKDYKELKKIARKKYIIALDSNSSKYYRQDSLKKYTVRYTTQADATYNFNSNASNTFNLLLSRYLNFADSNTNVNKGLYSNKLTVQSGTILGRIATYILYIIFAGVIIFLIIYRSTKKIKIAKRIKKEDKMRFIDQLTSLKNRNYLSENIEAWNKNTIYPQTTLIIDVNNIQYINDTYGYEEGDKQIKAAANILIKLQLDNTDIIRTDGTEFLVYFVGHTEKQIAAYIRKLNKEFKKLPYDYGVVMGYSTINDDIKLIEDAINEATLSVKEKKNEKEALKNEEEV